MIKTVATLTLLCASMQAQVAVQPSNNAESANVVGEWNKKLLAIVRTPGAQPGTIHPTRSFAMLHAAIYDAVNAIEGTHRPYLLPLSSTSPDASQVAAAATAGHDVLLALYPRFQTTLDAELERSLATVPEGSNKQPGAAIGQRAAQQLLAARSNDGSQIQPAPFVFGNAPGDYQSTPPNLPKPQLTLWSQVLPFTLQQASQFRPGPPPSLTDRAYSEAFNEVKSFGMAHRKVASSEQAFTGRFWNGSIQNYWNEIAQTAALAHGLTTAESARFFALLNLSFADRVIAFYDAKYTYNFWRPVTAIRAAATDNNPDTLADPGWLPEVGNTTPDPSYPGAHAVISSAAASVLQSFFGTDQFNFDVRSEVLAGVQRSFPTFSAGADEATFSRIFAGVHVRTDLTAGQQLGTEIAQSVVAGFLTPVGR